MRVTNKARPAVAAVAASAVSMDVAAPSFAAQAPAAADGQTTASIHPNWGDGSSAGIKNATARVPRTPVTHTHPAASRHVSVGGPLPLTPTHLFTPATGSTVAVARTTVEENVDALHDPMA